ncbi:MAG TPA: c-type cytochrome [Vicinamibacterales bacterium]|jgi:cytochrome c5|nr:c-type cytochrome [Vicinamibacterales bacterium]
MTRVTISAIVCTAFALVIGAVLGGAVRAQENDVPIYGGVFSPEQAARGKQAFEANCARCHRANLEGTERGPALKGDNFWSHWENETVATLFVKVRDNMPPNFTGAELDPQTKLDIVSHILSTNEFPAGRGEMKPDRDALDELQIVKKGAAASMPNFAIVQVVGCLARGSGGTWTLTHAGKPAKQASPFPAKAAAPSDRPLGNETFLLTSVQGFGPDDQAGHKVEAVGLIYRAPGDNRIDVTALRSVATGCGS